MNNNTNANTNINNSVCSVCKGKGRFICGACQGEGVME